MLVLKLLQSTVHIISMFPTDMVQLPPQYSLSNVRYEADDKLFRQTFFLYFSVTEKIEVLLMWNIP